VAAPQFTDAHVDADADTAMRDDNIATGEGAGATNASYGIVEAGTGTGTGIRVETEAETETEADHSSRMLQLSPLSPMSSASVAIDQELLSLTTLASSTAGGAELIDIR
jgi:hypothetical protein